jgi:hypothetical protein
VRALVVPDSADLRHLFEPVGSGFEPLISRVVRGSSQVLPSFASAGFEGPWLRQISNC